MIITSDKAIQLLQTGNPVAIPTETVYGLAAPITDPNCLKKVFEIKNRPFYDPLIVHVASLEMAKPLVQKMSTVFIKLAASFWPGPFTIVTPKSDKISDLITAGLPSVGIRIPKHSITLEIIQKLGIPLAAPSANIFSKTSPTTADHVLSEFESKVPVVDGGACPIGIESTVIGLIEFGDKTLIEIYRPGAILYSDIEKVLSGENFELKYSTSAVAPGQLENHYQPSVPLSITNRPSQEMAELTLSFDATLAARELYGKLRESSKSGIPLFINPDKYPKDGLWESIWERILKASTKS